MSIVRSTSPGPDLVRQREAAERAKWESDFQEAEARQIDQHSPLKISSLDMDAEVDFSGETKAIQRSPLPTPTASMGSGSLFRYEHTYKIIPPDGQTIQKFFSRQTTKTDTVILMGFSQCGVDFPPKEIRAKLPPKVLDSTAYKAFKASFAEIAKNCLDASVTEATLTIMELPDGQISLSLTDNGIGFPDSFIKPDEVGQEINYSKFAPTRDIRSIGIHSDKLGHKEKHGGAGLGLLMLFKALEKAGGHLSIANVNNPRSPTGRSARITLISPAGLQYGRSFSLQAKAEERGGLPRDLSMEKGAGRRCF